MLHASLHQICLLLASDLTVSTAAGIALHEEHAQLQGQQGRQPREDLQAQTGGHGLP